TLCASLFPYTTLFRSDNDVLAFLFLWRLIDGEHADVGKQDLRIDDIGAALVGILLALGQDHVDAVVGQDEAAGAGLRRNLGRNRSEEHTSELQSPYDL